MTSEIANCIDMGWNVGFYISSENTYDGIRNVIRWRAKNVSGEEKKSVRGFIWAQEAINDFCITVKGDKVEI
jgi:hypothetical protein